MRTVGDNEAELLVQWTNSSTAEWIRGSTLAFSDAISESELQSFIKKLDMEYVALPRKPIEPEPVAASEPEPVSEPESGLEGDLAEQAKELLNKGAGEGRAGAHESEIAGGGLGGAGENQAGVGGCVNGTSVATPKVVDGTAILEVALGEGVRGGPGSYREDQGAEATKDATADDTPGVASGESALGNGDKARSPVEDARGEPKEKEAENSTVWGTPTLSDINLLSVFWEGKLDANPATPTPIQ